MRRTILATSLILSMLAGCGPVGGSTVGHKGASPSPKIVGDSGGVTPPGINQTRTPAPGSTPITVAATPGTVGGGIVANNGAGLTGSFSAPAALVGNNGGGLIANNGGNIIANNGGGYRLLALSESPLANAVVRVLDAAGQPVKDAGGKAVTATTDATGHFAVAAALPAQNLLLEADLPAGKGVVRAVVPRDGGAKQVVDADLVSSLTTGYILSQYVRNQSDPDKVFEKLPGDVERETRAKAAVAVAAANTTPDTLLEADVVKTVEGLRQHDAALNGQMETVKKLLVAAGASDLGSGTPGTQVSLRGVDALAAGKDGVVYILTKADRRIWRLRADGILETAAGSTTAPTAGSLDGQAGVTAALDNPSQIATDGQGRLLFFEARGLFRLESDGKLKSLGAVGNPTTDPNSFMVVQDKVIAPGASDGALVATVEDHKVFATLPGTGDLGYGTAYVLWRVRDGAGATPLMYMGTDPYDYGEQTFTLAQMAWDGQTTVYALGRTTGSEDDSPPAGWQLFKIDLTTFKRTVVTTYGDMQPMLDTGGHLYTVDAAGKLHVKALFTNQDVPLAAPDTAIAAHMVLGSDGKLYTGSRNEVFRIEASGPVRVVGTGEQASSSNALQFFFQTLGGLVVSPTGQLLVGDTGTRKIYQVDAGKQVVPFLDVSTFPPSQLRYGPDGKLISAGNDATQIGTVDAAGTWTLLTTLPGLVTDFLSTADGTLYWSCYDFTQRQFVLGSFKDGQNTNLLTDQGQFALALDQNGKLLVAGNAQLRRRTATDFELVKADAAFDLPRNLAYGHSLAVDAKGRLYMARPDQHTILRYDPASGSVSTLAGVGGQFFTGSTVDDGIKSPSCPVFTPSGDLYFVDTDNRQVKLIASGDL